MRLTFRPYTPRDADACLALFDANVPTYFDASERPEYAAFLARFETTPPCAYVVGESPDGRVLACGGWFREDDDPALGGLAWGMEHGEWHGHGLGQQLLEVRMAGLAAMPGLGALRIRTSQHTEGFYARAGFVVTRRIPDGHAPGIDFVEMRRDLFSPEPT